MTYTVVWQPVAQVQLADTWLHASHRGAVNQAADRAEVVLGFNPSAAGESRDPGRRVLLEYPLVIAFEVIEDDRKVNVLGVRLRERRGHA